MCGNNILGAEHFAALSHGFFLMINCGDLLFVLRTLINSNLNVVYNKVNKTFVRILAPVTVYARFIQKISSFCEYGRCSAAVTIVLMRAGFVDSVARHGRNLQTFEQCLRIVLCVYNV